MVHELQQRSQQPDRTVQGDATSAYMLVRLLLVGSHLNLCLCRVREPSAHLCSCKVGQRTSSSQARCNSYVLETDSTSITG